MRYRIVTVTCLMAISLYVVGCGDDDGRVTVGEEDSGGRVELGLDQQLGVSLFANASTGYEWQIEESGALELVDEEYAGGDDDSEVGSGGTVTFVFQPQRAGTSTLTMVYLRPFASDPPTETFELTVTVTG